MSEAFLPAYSHPWPQAFGCFLGLSRKQLANPKPIGCQTSNVRNPSESQGLERSIAIAELPLALSLWQLPEPRIMRPHAVPGDDEGQPWLYCDDVNTVRALCRRVAEEPDSRNVALEIGAVNRTNFLRFLAKTAHAYAVAEVGLDAFEPLLIEIILGRENDISRYVGGYYGPPLPGAAPENLVLAHVGQAVEGPGAGLLIVALQFYPLLGSPIYSVIVGRTIIDLDAQAFDIGYDVSG